MNTFLTTDMLKMNQAELAAQLKEVQRSEGGKGYVTVNF